MVLLTLKTKPKTVTAVQLPSWDSFNNPDDDVNEGSFDKALNDIAEWCNGTPFRNTGWIVFNDVLGQVQMASPGDWIVKDEYGNCECYNEAQLTFNYNLDSSSQAF